MENKKLDLRIVKTRRNIKNAFLELLRKKPVEKISVTEIAEKAAINKGTFYLHYQDVYALYDEVINDTVKEFCDGVNFYGDFFEDPTAFINKLAAAMREDLFHKKFPYLEPSSSATPLPVRITEEFKQRIYDLEILPQTIANDIALEYIFSGLFNVLFKYYNAQPAETLETSVKIIKALYAASR